MFGLKGPFNTMEDAKASFNYSDAFLRSRGLAGPFGNLSLAYGAGIVIPDIQRQYSDPQRMPRVVFVTVTFISCLFLTLASSAYSAVGGQITENILFTIYPDEATGLTSLGFAPKWGTVVLAYLFMHLHITIAFSVLINPAFYISERLVLGMHKRKEEEDIESAISYAEASTPQGLLSEIENKDDEEAEAAEYPAPRAPPRPHVAAAPYKPLDIFPAATTAPAAATHQRTAKSGRPSLSRLADLPLLFRPTANAATPPYALAAAPAPTAATVRSSGDVLAALRARTLLDLSCMREFSLLRARPRPERDLQQLSARSAYDVQVEHLRLQLELQQRQPLAQSDRADVHSPRPVCAARRPHPRKAVESRAAATSTPRTPRPPPQAQAASLRSIRRVAKPGARPTTRTPTPTRAVASQQGFLLEQDLPALLAATGYSRPELFARWARFKALCSLAPAARGVDKETLRRGVPQLSVEDQLFVDRAFQVLDVDGSGTLEWPEFVAALAALEKGDSTRRVELLFRAYDLNGDGFVQRHEAQQFFLAGLLAPATADVVDEARHFVAKMFRALGREQHDTIRAEDALRFLREHPAADAYSLLGRTMVAAPAAASTVEAEDAETLGRRAEDQPAQE